MQYRKDPLVDGECYHIFSRSIAKFVIFNNVEDYARFLEIAQVYQYKNFEYTYRDFKRLSINTQTTLLTNLKKESPKYIDIISYCLMPTHIHFALKQLSKEGISKYMAKVLNSYSKYFNAKHHRKGPLWEGRFKSVLVRNNEQLMHLTRYHHLNPATAGIVKNPFEWEYSSLNEYSNEAENGICEFNDLVDMKPSIYRKFVLDQKDYQKSLAEIKSFLIDNYSG